MSLSLTFDPSDSDDVEKVVSLIAGRVLFNEKTAVPFAGTSLEGKTVEHWKEVEAGEKGPRKDPTPNTDAMNDKVLTGLVAAEETGTDPLAYLVASGATSPSQSDAASPTAQPAATNLPIPEATDPLAGLVAVSSPPGSPATEPTPAAADPLAGLTQPTVFEDFVVFTATGEKRAGYAHAADAVKVFAHDIGLATGDLEDLWKANQPLYERQDRGGKSSMSRAYTKRKEELAAVVAAMAGEAPSNPETGEAAMTQAEFFNAFSTYALKAGAQAITEIWSHFGVTGYQTLDASHYRKALEMIKQVVDNKGK